MQVDPAVVGDYLRGLQGRIVAAVEAADGGTAVRDAWQKAPGEMLQGSGLTCILEGGALFERAGCGFSQVRGPKLPPSATQHRPELAGAPFGDDKYPRFKTWCDEYFFLKHRSEQRGIGGVFFDDFSELGFDDSFAMLRAVGDGFLPAYMPIVERRRDTPYGERERAFQLYRRGRYVEFNLVWDRGTHFGLQSGGRTESILLSMPPQASWAYQQVPAPGTPEAALYSDFIVRREWL